MTSIQRNYKIIILKISTKSIFDLIMTQEHKDLLLKELCSRLPYGVKVCCFNLNNHDWYNIEMIDISDNEVYISAPYPYMNGFSKIDDVKPYLLPISSMTEEQHKEFYDKYCWNDGGDNFEMDSCSHYYALEKFNWLLKNHFDFRGLIPMGLALDATNLGIY